MRDKKFMFVIVLGLVFLLTVGLTYAYFSLTVSGNDVAETINVNTTKLELKYTDGKEIKANSIEPGWTITKSLTIENTGSEEVYYDLGWQELTNEIEQDELKISGTCDSGSCEDIEESIVPLVSNQKASSGKVVNPYKSGIAIAGGETHSYTIKLEFINYTDKAQNYNQGKRLYGVLGVAESTKTFNLTLNLEDGNGNPLANKEVTIHSEPKTSTSDSAGKVVFNDVEVGMHNLEVKTDTKTLNAKVKVQGSNNNAVEKTDNNYTIKGTSKENNINLGITIDSEKLTDVYVKGSKLNAYLIDNYSALGLTKIEQAAVNNQTYDSTEYRYQGANPNNYITFNNEEGKWRIIGVFEVETPNDDGTYTKENKVKIIRDSIGTSAYDGKTTLLVNYKVSTINSNLNNSNGAAPYDILKNNSSYITKTRYYMGNVSESQMLKGVYSDERSKRSGSANDYDDFFIGLIYPSDYMYASRSCYEKENNTSTKLGYSTSESNDYRACISDNWLYTGSDYWSFNNSKYCDEFNYYTDIYRVGKIRFTSTNIAAGPSTNDLFPIYISKDGRVYYQNREKDTYEVRPSLYLSADVTLMSGNGTIDSPFAISIE